MSVIVIGRFKADPKDLEKVFIDHADELKAISADAKSKGGIHHQFVAGDGEVLIVDEWNNAASFQSFFESQTQIPEILKSANVQGPPDFEIHEVMDSPDRF
jgi:heme-degrading monooxygenase HmoA